MMAAAIAMFHEERNLPSGCMTPPKTKMQQPSRRSLASGPVTSHRFKYLSRTVAAYLAADV